jgi:glutathione peroxidase
MGQAGFAANIAFSASLLDARELDMTSFLRGGFPAMEKLQGTVYEFSAPLLDGRTVNLDDFRGQVLLIVNTASKCGFTPQYAGLEDLYRIYKERGFQVLGFPCNQFGAQEPGAAAEIAAFCAEQFSVTFPVFDKIDVNGPGAHPLYRFLKQAKPGILGALGMSGIKWNFTKFLVDRSGNVVSRFGPSKNPKHLAPAIERILPVNQIDTR